jgi:uncharacterized protein (TIGR03437 family)
VLFDDVPVPLVSVAANLIQAVVPFGLATQRETMLVVEHDGVRSAVANRIGVISATPAIFVTQMLNQYLPAAAALNEDGSVNSPSNPALPGSVITVFGTGFGALSPSPLDGMVLSSSLSALQQTVSVFSPGFTTLLSAGPAPAQVAGMTQVRFRLPDVVGEPPTIFLFAGVWSSDAFSVWMQAAPHRRPRGSGR